MDIDLELIRRLSRVTGLNEYTLYVLYRQGWEVVRQPPPNNHEYMIVKGQ